MKLLTVTPTHIHKESTDHPQELSKYLSEIDERLFGLLPDEIREDLVNETAFWVERGMRDRILTGKKPAEASHESILKHGTAKMVAEKLLDEWYENGVDTPMLNFLGRANGMAGAMFAFANLAYIGWLQYSIYFPTENPLKLPFIPAVVRSVLPDYVPMPELTWQYAITVGYPLLMPFIIGAIAGRVIPAYAPRAVYNGMIPVLFSAFALGCLLLPNTTGLLYALVQMAWWLPAGSFAAWISSSLRRRSRRGQYRRAARTHPPTSQNIQELT